MFADKIRELIAFNPALIYLFEYEGYPDEPDSGEVLVGQYTDILLAYLYAQDTILPVVREKGFASVEAKTLLEWINTLQIKSSKTILGWQRFNPGVYRDASEYLWNAGPQFFQVLSRLLLQLMSSKSTTWASKEAVALFATEFSMDAKKIEAFLLLLKNIHEDSSIMLFPSQTAFISKYSGQAMGAFRLFEKLNAAYNQGRLGKEERALIHYFGHFGVPAERIEPEMQALATETLAAYATFDGSDLDQVANYLANVFSRFIKIHPYRNANGRTATCLLNILLRSFDLPSIVLRFPQEANDPSSEYAQAILHLNESQEPLKALIKKRIIAEKASPYKDELLAETIMLRMDLNETMRRIKADDPKSTINSLLEREVPVPVSDSQIAQRDFLISSIRVAQSEEKRLQQVKKIKGDLNTCSGIAGWKEKGSIYWLETTEAVAKRIGSELQLTLKRGVVISATKKKPEVWVVKCEGFDEKALTTLAELKRAHSGVGHSAHSLFAAPGLVEAASAASGATAAMSPT